MTDSAFSQQLGDWTAYFALTGGAAATLLGLIFVAVSLRLEIFHRGDVADVRLFARLTLGTFLLSGAVAGLALAPHDRAAVMSGILVALSLAGLAVLVRFIQVWRVLNLDLVQSPARHDPVSWGSWIYIACLVLGYAGLLFSAVLLWRRHPDAVGLLALDQALLLGLGTIGAWTMMSHAGAATSPPASGG